MERGQIGTATVILLVIVGIFILGILWIIGSYNGLVSADVGVENAWGKVQSAYQRRADLIPNLVETVKGYRDHEANVLTTLTELRSQAGQVKSAVDSATTPAQLETAGSEMSSVLSRLMVVVEAYPDLKASENFLALQDEIAGTENRINYERNGFNDAVKIYKQKVRSFPTNIIAGMFGFGVDKWEMFQAEAGAETAPKVDFE